MNAMLTKCDHPIDGLFRDFWRTGMPQARTRDLTLRPRADIHESEQEYLIRMDLPGVQKDDLNVSVEKNTLTISASRTEKEEEKHNAIHTERYTASQYVRSFTLGDDANADGIKGSLKDGVLTISIPKLEKALPRKIEVA
jgi:HSP20 family protein